MTDNNENRNLVSRRERERENHKMEILEAAERIFVREGFSAKIESIAREANYSVGSIYNFFPSKDELFKGVLLRIMAVRVVEMEKSISSAKDDPWNGISLIVRAWIRHHLDHGDFLHVVASQYNVTTKTIWGKDDPIEDEIDRNVKEYRERLESFFELVSNRDEARDLSPTMMYVAFEGYVRTSYFIANRKGKGEIDISQVEAEVTDAVKRLFSK